MPHDESQPLPTVRPHRPPSDTEPAETDRGSTSQSSIVPQLRVAGPLAPPAFELGDELGRGGMGVVYAARDVEVGREVAVKLLRPEYVGHESAVRRFVEEAQITGQLQHPGIPAVYRVGTMPDGSPFLAMKLVKGQTLADLLKARPSPAADRGRFAAIFEGVCQAVGYAHAHRVIHRDLKPQNIMVGAFGEVQVMDWGLAKVLTADGVDPRRSSLSTDTEPDTRIRAIRGADDATSAGSILGTPAFMPPEQAIGAVDRLDARSDVFGLGAILCVILTGKPPYTGATAEATRQMAAYAKLADAFARLDALGADPGLVALCQRCLSADPADRPADGAVVGKAIADLRAAADERVRHAETAKAVADGRRKVWYVVAGALTAGLVTAVGLTAVAVREAGRAEAARGEAVRAQQDADTKRDAAVAAQKEEEAQRKAAEAVVRFFEDKVFAAGRPKGLPGGLGRDVSLKAAAVASLPALATGFKDLPLVEARLRHTLGTTFSYLRDDARAIEQQEKARALYVAHRGPEHPDTLASTHSLAITYSAAGRLRDALKLREETLAARKRVLGPDHPDTLQTMMTLANSYADAGRRGDAWKLREETLTAQRRILGPDHPDTLASMHNLANSYAVAGRREDALTLREETLAARKRVLPPDHSDTLTTMHNLANSYTDAGRVTDALEMAEEAVAGQKRVLGPDHPITLGGMLNLANKYDDAGRRDDALELREETLAAQRRVVGPDDPETLKAMHNLANSYAAAGRREDALKLREETLAARKRVLPPNHPDTLLTMNNVANSYADAGRRDDALKLREETLAAQKRVLGPNHPDTLGSMFNLASSYETAGRPEVIPLIDDLIARAAGEARQPGLLPRAADLRLRHFEAAGDPAGCRATAEMWETLNRTDAGSRYDAACMRAVTARVHRLTGQSTDADREADLAMRWLQKAISAGYKDAKHMKDDDDLTALRGRADFRLLVAKLDGKTFELAPPPRAGWR